MYKNAEKHLKGVEKVIDTEAFTEAGGIIDRALDLTVSKDDNYIKNVKVTNRCKKGAHKSGRKSK
jgi:hypothetical protein